MSSVVDAPTGLPHGSGGSEVGGSVPETCGEPGGVTPGRVRAASHGAGGPARRTGADYDARLERRSSASRVSSARIRGHDGPVARCPECPPNAAGGRPPRVRSAGRTGPPLDERRTSADRDVRPAESVTDTRARRSGPLPVSRCSVPPLGRVGAPSGVETRSTRRVVPGRYSPGGNTARSRGLLDDSRNTPRRGATGAQTGYPRRDSRRTGRRCRPLAGLTGSETLLQPEWGARPSVVPFPATDSDARSRPSRRCGRSRSSAGHSTVERPVRMRASSSRRLPGYVRPVPDFDDRSPNWTVRPRSRRRVDPPYRDPRSLDRTPARRPDRSGRWERTTARPPTGHRSRVVRSSFARRRLRAVRTTIRERQFRPSERRCRRTTASRRPGWERATGRSRVDSPRQSRRASGRTPVRAVTVPFRRTLEPGCRGVACPIGS